MSPTPDASPPTPARARGDRAAGALKALLGQTTATAPRAYVVVSLALVVLVAVTTTVASRYHAERAAMARDHYARGLALAQAGDRSGAVRHLREALALRRGDTTTELALATTLLEEGRPREASAYLTDVLRKNPTNGFANLSRARVARALGEEQEAEGYYQRAIYGTWPRGSEGRRLDTRFELVELLLARGERARVVGELEQIKADAPADVDVARRVGRLFQQAGALDRAIVELRQVVAARRSDGDAWAWLCDAQFSERNYGAAIAAGERALSVRPDPGTRERVETARGVLALDPSARRLTSRERERRARALLERVVAALSLCLSPAEGAASAEVEAQRKAADVLLSRRPRGSAESADAALELAEGLWRTVVSTCPDVRTGDRVLVLVMDRVEASETGA